MNAVPGVYAIVCTTTGARYIGSTVNLKNRERQHFGHLRRGDHKNRTLQAAFDAQAGIGFEFVTLDVVYDQDARLEAEQRWMDATTNKLNMAPRAGAVTGIRRRDETRAALRAANLGKRHTSATREQMSRQRRGEKKTYKTTAAHAANIARALRGKPKSSAHVQKMRSYTHSEESRARISASLRGKSPRPRDPEHTRRQVESARLGRLRRMQGSC